jgi:hypothetical protein
MSEATTLVPLRCTQCETALPAQPDEIAWVCANCGTGQMLDLNTGLVPQPFHFHAGLEPEKTGRPFWVLEGQVTLSRDTYSAFNKKGESQKFWAAPRRFYIPAYTLSVDELVDTVTTYLERQPELKEGHAERFLPITLPQEDLQAVAEYVITGVEAHRKDDVRQVQLTLKLGEPQLWVLR